MTSPNDQDVRSAKPPFGGIRFERQTPERRAQFLPMTSREMRQRGWQEVDVVFVTGDAYVDHPSFAMAILGRLLEAAGFRVAILSQPDWRSVEAWKTFGRPRLFFAVSAGNMDSMINHYTANKKVRNDDAYSPGGEIGKRPDRATLAYCQRAREAYPGVPVVAGGVEASLRRIAHYDYWSDTVRRSILMDCKADLLGFGMGERTILEIARRLDAGGTIRDLRDLRGVAYRLGAKETAEMFPDVPRNRDSSKSDSEGPAAAKRSADPVATTELLPAAALEHDAFAGPVVLPSFEDVASDKVAFARMTRLAHHETNPFNARPLVQRHAAEAVVVNPPSLPLSQAEMDLVYGLPFSREPHAAYHGRKIPAFEVVRTSVQIMRGCFGGCTFCSITAHEGRIIQSRSQRSVLDELRAMSGDRGFSGTVSDIGGPTANMYEMRCTKPEVEAICRRQSCVHPKICKLLGTDHGPLRTLMQDARSVPGVKKVFVASGIRMDLARRDPDYLRELAQHHVGGYLKVAPEHTDAGVLEKMKKPGPEDFLSFDRAFRKASREVGKDQYLIPYFIASHPGSDLKAMIELALFLKRSGYKPDQVQDFIPSPFDIAACMYHTGLDPMSMKPVKVARKMQDRRFQRALLQFFKPENYFEVHEALRRARRTDLIGDGPGKLIPSQPPRAAVDQRRRRANRDLSEQHEGDHVRGTTGSPGYRPHRASSSGRRRRSR
ncbi:MAG: YgiQ family radical SAM protein [Candidatus Eisenbacteria bacterium]|uniref:YgiQ family radical SAM protein n=1 Tax=Eiseniibacteriota bacterium TaxID=2212470 RepID=A0A956LVH1_UNCEI|nr:YgiQ family radical SAM protein [Candidatus Eisenbacteria bacterium]